MSATVDPRWIAATPLIAVECAQGIAELRRQCGSHSIYVRSNDAARVVIPMHLGLDLKRKTLRGIISDLKITPEEFVKLL